MEVFIPVLISVTAILGLIALGVGWIIMAPLSSHADDHSRLRAPKLRRIG